MNDEKVKQFIELAGQKGSSEFITGTEKQRELGAQLLLSEVLEYIIKGLGVIPVVNGVEITEPDSLTYNAQKIPDKLELVDGLCDVAYTMFWNAVTFGIPLEEAFIIVCENNLEKFVKLPNEFGTGLGELEKSNWHCNKNISWPVEVSNVYIVSYNGIQYAVGKDKTGKVRKPSSFSIVDLNKFLI